LPRPSMRRNINARTAGNPVNVGREEETMRRRSIGAALLGLIAATGFALPAQAADPIRIGLGMAQTGPLAANGWLVDPGSTYQATRLLDASAQRQLIAPGCAQGGAGQAQAPYAPYSPGWRWRNVAGEALLFRGGSPSSGRATGRTGDKAGRPPKPRLR
jgi:hypothetical protein